jgi:hypothetical protein
LIEHEHLEYEADPHSRAAQNNYNSNFWGKSDDTVRRLR